MAEDTYSRSPDEQMRLENLSLQWQVEAAEADNADLRQQVRTLTKRVNERSEPSA